MARKVYVEVTAKFDETGLIMPLSILWEDGRQFEIDKVLDVRKASSLKAGGAGYAEKVVMLSIVYKTPILFD